MCRPKQTTAIRRSTYSLEPLVVVVVSTDMAVAIVVIVVVFLLYLAKTTSLLVVCHIFRGDQLPGAMSVQVVAHIIPLHFHIVAKLIKRGSTDLVAFTVYLPGDGGV